MTRDPGRSAALPVLCLALAVTGCAAPLATPRADTVSEVILSISPTPVESGSPARAEVDVEAAVRAAAPRATIGALVFDRVTGQDLVAVNPDRPFRSASLVKLLIAIDLLADGVARPGMTDEIQQMLSYSDDGIASRLWVEGGMTAIVDRTVALIGLTDTATGADPGRWGDTLLSARDVARIYRYILDELPDAGRRLIVGALAATPRHAADGWDQYFGIPDGIGGTWAVKQGWSDSPNDLVVHSTGLVGADWRHVVVLLVQAPIKANWPALREGTTNAATEIAPLLK